MVRLRTGQKGLARLSDFAGGVSRSFYGDDIAAVLLLLLLPPLLSLSLSLILLTPGILTLLQMQHDHELHRQYCHQLASASVPGLNTTTPNYKDDPFTMHGDKGKNDYVAYNKSTCCPAGS